ncbi:S8 family serine peptidase [Actinoplanes sp. ATCC 53533]|uniref:S8 family serine peptidase n=1 Tax=Actinoplanes sp. ATCC 53533 TaxID=1288362 RepID=UPI0013152D67|nr:S8 family serine peptidase [Actinoplanes sp. ATCC 53533]
MKYATRRVTVGALSAAVVATMAGVSTWAFAGETAAEAPVRLIVSTRSGADATAPLRTVSALGARSVDAGGGPAQQAMAALSAQTLEVSAARSKRVIAALRSDPSVSYVEVDHVRKASDLSPNDPMYTDGHQVEVDQVRLPAAWETTTGSAVKIAVLDTGVAKVGDLSGAVIGGWNYVSNNSNANDDQGHGTTVASIIGARGNNGAGMAGGCWSCVIMPVKVLDRYGSGYDSNVAKGIVFAVDKGAKIINMSLSGAAYSKTLSNAVAYANRKGVLVVAAAGNEGLTSARNTKRYPAALTDVLAVGATAQGSDARADFSSYNKKGDSWVDMAAPGVITGMDRAGVYHTNEEGTSFAAPMVAGAAGLLKTARPTYTGWSLQHALLKSARPIATNGWSRYGMLDAAKALTIATDVTPPVITGVSAPRAGARHHGTITVTPTGVKDTSSGVLKAALYANGVFQSHDFTSPYSLPYNSGRRNGAVRLTIRVYDKAGNQASFDRSIIVDNILPKVKITSAPKNKAKVKGSVKITATASDASGIARVELVINGKVASKDITSPYAFSFNAARQPKKMKVQIRAVDKAGNVKYDATRNYTR